MKWYQHKKIKVTAVVIAAFSLLGLLGWSNTSVSASSFRSGSSPRVTADETLDHSLYIAGGKLDIKGTINGDVFCAGQQVTIDATVNGDIICGAQQITINGTVKGDIRAAGAEVSIGAVVEKNLTAFGSTVELSKTSSVAGDSTLGGSNIKVDGKIGRDAVITGSQINITAPIGRDASITSEDITFGESATIGRNLDYTSRTVQSFNRSVVKGETHFHKSEVRQETVWDRVRQMAQFLIMLLAAWLVGSLVISRPLTYVQQLGKRSFGLIFSLGILWFAILPIVAMLLFVTQIGVFASLLLLAIWLAIVACSGVFVAHRIGTMIVHQSGHPVTPVLVGGLILSVACIVPFIGVPIAMFAVIIGSGIIIDALFARSKKPAVPIEPIKMTESVKPPKTTTATKTKNKK